MVLLSCCQILSASLYVELRHQRGLRKIECTGDAIHHRCKVDMFIFPIYELTESLIFSFFFFRI